MEYKDLTKNQKLCYDHTKKNGWFGTDANGKDFEDLEIMVEAGLMRKRKAPDWSGDDFIYYCN